MKRSQLHLDEVTYHLLRKKTSEKEISIYALTRQVLQECLEADSVQDRCLEDFKFIGSGNSQKSDIIPICQRHDEVLAKGFAR